MWQKGARVSLSRVRAQGATEYLLILAVVLGIAAVAIFFLTTTPPSATITGTAELKSGDNTTVIFIPSTTMTPKTIAAADWSWAVYHDGTEIGSGTGTATLERGLPVELPCTSAAQSGDKVKIRYKGTWYDAAMLI